MTSALILFLSFFFYHCTDLISDHILGAKAAHQLGLLWTQRVSDTTQVATKYTTSTDLNVAPTLEAVLEQKVRPKTEVEMN